MKFLHSKSRAPIALGLAFFAAAAALLCNWPVNGGESQAKQTAPPAKKTEKKLKKKLSGAELYAVHCNRCHPERYAPERTDAQWETILLHMRTRANLPAAQARTILKYLQEDSGK